LFTVVDVETTGGAAGRHRIIEIAIVKFNGAEIVDRFHSLVNPEKDIPPFISSLTGIDNAMVADAPKFHEIASAVSEFTADCVFVAHNANFDYSFVKREFELLGISFARVKLCTVRLARKILPGLPSYGLGSLCRQLGFENAARHRAHGDAEVTTRLLKHLIDSDAEQFIPFSLKKNSGEASLPPNLSRQAFRNLPEATGVYYFHDARGNVIYVGKARSIKSRVSGHFTGRSSQEKRLFLNSIYDISYRLAGNELIALLEESREIKKYWPKFNRAQKRTDGGYGMYSYQDREGYNRLFANRIQKGNTPMATFSSFQEARDALHGLVRTFALCPKLSGLQKRSGPCFDHEVGACDGACAGKIGPSQYNERVAKALLSFEDSLDNYAFVGCGRSDGEQSVVLVRNGTYLGHGYVPADQQIQYPEELEEYIERFPDNQDIQRILSMYIRKPADQQIVEFKPVSPLSN
jgi:DNA polymerase-3 subunit epsilon